MSETKICTKCGLSKPADAAHFYRKKAASDGLRPECKPCDNSRTNRGIRAMRRKRAEEMILMRQRGRSWGQIAFRFGVNKSNARAAVLLRVRAIGP